MAKKRPWFRSRRGWKTLGIGTGLVAVFILVPLFGGVLIFGSVAGLAANSTSLHTDTELRKTATVASGRVTDVQVVYHPGYKGAGHTTCTPVVEGTVDGAAHTWTLTNFEQCDGYYFVDEHVRVMYDPADLDHAGVYADDIPATYRHNIRVAEQVGVLGLVMVAVSAGCWVWVIRHERRNKAERRQGLSDHPPTVAS